jgi:6,7-dimethyl-8-ribityllumazine synthase
MGKNKKTPSGKKNKIAIVVSRFNKEISEGLLRGAVNELHANGIGDKSINIFHCPGSFEIPMTAKKLCKSKKYSTVICLGAVIKGETAHFEHISYAVTKGIMELNLTFDIPVIFGVLTCYTDQQAEVRSKEGEGNKGAEAAQAALEMIELMGQIVNSKK